MNQMVMVSYSNLDWIFGAFKHSNVWKMKEYQEYESMINIMIETNDKK